MSDIRYDHIVDEWLSALGRAAADLPPDRRGELVADLREHIAVARAELGPETEAGVRTILDRLGDPDVIVAEARYGQTGPPPSPPAPGYAPEATRAAPAAPGGVSPVAGGGGDRPRTPRWLVAVVAAVVALCVVGCLAGLLGLVAFRADTSGTVVNNVPVPQPASSRVQAPGR